MNRKQLAYAVLLPLMLILDQLVKAWVRSSLPIHGSFAGLPFPGIFELTLTYNEGIAFGMLQGAGKFLTPVAVLIAGGAGWYSWKHPHESVWSHVAMGLLSAGALGNLYDRLVHQRVTDMFWFRLINFPVFNVADSCITIATVILMMTWWGEAVRQPKAETVKVSTPEESTELNG